MKSIFAILLFVCFSDASRNWITLPKHNLEKLDKVAKDAKHATRLTSFGSKSVFSNLLRREENSQVRSEEHEDITDITTNFVQVMLQLLPDLKELKGKRVAMGNAYAKEFAEALKNEMNGTAVQILFGKHIRLLHVYCNDRMIEFAKEVNKSGLFGDISRDDLDFAVIMEGVIDRTEAGGRFTDEYNAAVEEYELHSHPVVKVISAIGGLFADAVCDPELDGYLNAVQEEMNEPGLGEEDEGACHKESFIEMAYRIKCYCTGTQDYLKKFQNSQEQLSLRALHLMFEGGCFNKEVYFVTRFVELGRRMLDIYYRLHFLIHEARQKESEVRSEIIDFYEQGKEDAGDLVLAKFVLGGIRKAILVGKFMFTCPAGCPKEQRKRPRANIDPNAQGHRPRQNKALNKVLARM